MPLGPNASVKSSEFTAALCEGPLPVPRLAEIAAFECVLLLNDSHAPAPLDVRKALLCASPSSNALISSRLPWDDAIGTVAGEARAIGPASGGGSLPKI